jgi:DNA replication licensing factor MCM4
MDKILTGHSAADRKQRSDIAEGVDDILQGMQGRKARLSEIVLKLKERNASIEISVQEVRDSALLLAEQDRAIVKGDLVQLI